MKYETWDDFFKAQGEKLYFSALQKHLEECYQKAIVFPCKNDVFRAFKLTELKDAKVVIIGQDPYHQPGQANGLAFSVHKDVPLPRSLINIYREIESDTGEKMDFTNGDLTYLAEQGVLLFNPIFTVEKDKPLSHDFYFYKDLTREILLALSALDTPIVYILWGSKAQAWKKYIRNKTAFIIETSHPSPLAANRGGFFGQHTFTRANKFLTEHGLKPIKWNNF